jgi:hypothetical protein
MASLERERLARRLAARHERNCWIGIVVRAIDGGVRDSLAETERMRTRAVIAERYTDRDGGFERFRAHVLARGGR